LSNIRDAALNLGYVEALPVTGHPFEHWRNCLNNLPLGQYMSFEHDPVRASGWPLEEITVWVAIALTPPMSDWPEGCGEISAYYMRSEERVKRRIAWENATIALGYEIVPHVTLPERAVAIRAGLGVHGLNGLLITPKYGSFVSITVLLVRSSPPPDARGSEYDQYLSCEKCGNCIKACPTGAISEKGFDSLICLRSYISHPEHMDEDDYPKMGRRIQGCDTCQKVCPKNIPLDCDNPPNAIIECVKLEKLLTEPNIEFMSQVINSRYLPENQIKSQAVLAAANTGRKDLLHLIEALISDGDKSLSTIAHWATEHLRNL
jgi:epoxyqueuosine reductase QueG